MEKGREPCYEKGNARGRRRTDIAGNPQYCGLGGIRTQRGAYGARRRGGA